VSRLTTSSFQDNFKIQTYAYADMRELGISALIALLQPTIKPFMYEEVSFRCHLQEKYPKSYTEHIAYVAVMGMYMQPGWG